MKNVLNGFSNAYPTSIAGFGLFVGADDRDCEGIPFFCVAGCDPYSGVLLLFATERPIAGPGFAVWRMSSSILLQSIPSGKGVYPELLSGISKLDCGEEYCNRWSYSSADLEFRLHVRRTLDGGC